jgi:CRISPR-associated protein Csm3
MYGKIIISSTLKVLTGLHIGGSSAFSAIGAVDSPVITNPITQQPIIPGSSLKGKMRTLLVKSVNKGGKLPQPNDDSPEIARLFGTASSEKDKAPLPSRLQFADAFLSNPEKFSEIGVTEIKSENTINRVNSVAMPRQIERVVSGAEFSVKIVYDLLNKDEFEIDMKNTAKAMKLLQLDYLGGHGSRGSGRVSFENIELKPVMMDEEKIDLSPIQSIFKEVEDYELLSV